MCASELTKEYVEIKGAISTEAKIFFEKYQNFSIAYKNPAQAPDGKPVPTTIKQFFSKLADFITIQNLGSVENNPQKKVTVN